GAKGGDRWLADVPATIAALEDRWGITVGERLAGGTASYVATAVTATGEQVVVKISVPGVDFGREVRTLRAAAGRGYVRLLAADLDRNAALLEPLGGSLSGSGLPPERQLAVLADLLPLAWAVPPDRLAPTDKAAELAEFVGAFGRSAVVDEALRCAGRRSAAYDPDRCVVLHGDAAAANVLRRPGDGWVFVDPDGFVGDPAYDRGVAVRDWCAELLAAVDPRPLLRSYCLVLGGDPDATWDWGFLERVSTGLYVASLGGDGGPHLDSAARLLA
ncbi:MAG TPA: aminoglycoside phosphotransferase family protein, partial [Mycobacteriales bacterium]|nr:aminoglycoside phosphotransferase family protein [Mycobacteriales bacterium]